MLVACTSSRTNDDQVKLLFTTGLNQRFAGRLPDPCQIPGTWRGPPGDLQACFSVGPSEPMIPGDLYSAQCSFLELSVYESEMVDDYRGRSI